MRRFYQVLIYITLGVLQAVFHASYHTRSGGRKQVKNVNNNNNQLLDLFRLADTKMVRSRCKPDKRKFVLTIYELFNH